MSTRCILCFVVNMPNPGLCVFTALKPVSVQHSHRLQRIIPREKEEKLSFDEQGGWQRFEAHSRSLTDPKYSPGGDLLASRPSWSSPES